VSRELPELFDPHEAASFLRVSRSCLAKWRCSGTGPPHIRVGSRIRYSRIAVELWLAGRVRTSTSEEDKRNERVDDR
jgi:predicted DNA-binding transcriptional regulator AlpA